ncbi:CRISPR-associated protein Cas4 [Synergistes jonesii]|uniref:CRISPR-associated protein Cas4 n=1 Tax=Synergistes jonesii TaxID=2754 RepID=UPI00248E2D0C|nr:CRISPR-associated protein Cas4 [Synergistes jonesii]
MYADDDDLLLISGLQHLTFCERQWVLIHVEQLWAENFLTVEGGHLHENVHQIGSESRGEVKLATGLYLRSSKLGLYGVADMVEFHRDDERGVVIPGFKDKTKKWLPYPIEYKRGRKRWDNADEIQMCAQAICLEEMLGCSAPEGAIFYGEPKRRVKVALTEALRSKVAYKCDRARVLASGSDRPVYNYGKQCKNCSMREHCLPEETRLSARSLKYIEEIFKLKD